MALRKVIPSGDAPSTSMRPLSFTNKVQEEAQLAHSETSSMVEPDVDIDLREVYFLIMHFLSAGPCQRTYGQFWNELLEHQLLPRRYHAWYSRSGVTIGDENDDGLSFPLGYNKLMERFPHIQKDHLVRLLKQLILSAAGSPRDISDGNAPNASNVPTLLGTGSFSLLDQDKIDAKNNPRHPPVYMRWPHMHVDQVRGLSLREIGGGFPRHHRAPTTRAACYAIAKPSTMVQKMQNIRRLRGHRNAVYCAIFDLSGRYVITGSDDRLVKIWSMETAHCLASCRGHEGDITDLAVSLNNALVASSSNDCIIRVWRLPDGMPVSVLRGHTGAVTAIAFSPRSPYHLLSSSDDGTCRIWDARNSQISPKIYIQRPSDAVAGRNGAPSSNNAQQRHQIFCCAFNANGTVFVTGSSDNLARVWSAFKAGTDDSNEPNHEMDVLSGPENDVNYVQFSGCAVASKFQAAESLKDENFPKFKNSWFTHDNIVTCSRDGSAIIWIPRSRRSHGKVGRWTRAYHLKVPPPPIPQPPRGPRQRILPTPRGVNMIIWSLDNRFVLAAIMDCRICVWNAADGSLVHSLKGHTESTYVLDVHPSNPRVAMSAGYDGKTIVWDIWEGKPIKTYEISRFQLVDGKFSPDGTSIILSDDVGQIYILTTGEGESQNDAKYDQFFLGDYRPLIQDAHGNFLDQETQLPPYRRNMIDLLCDSSMVPYPEPYQSKYQRQRLGALNREWQPSSLKLAVGPDITLDQHYEMLPLPDLDILVDPLPEFIDAVDWEPEMEVLSDDADSEYNVTEDNSSGKEQCSLSFDSSAEAGSSENDSDPENASKDVLRRSRRKKIKADGEIMTSSGRRVKRRNLDEYDDLLKSNRIRNSASRKVSQKKSSTSKSLRPQRAAARSALSMFSRLKGASAGKEAVSSDAEDEVGMEDEFSGSESTMPDSNTLSDESDNSQRMQKHLNSKGKEIAVVDCEILMKPQEFSESYTTARSRKKLIFKLPIRDLNGLVSSDNIAVKDRQSVLLGPSKASEEGSSSNWKHLNMQDSHFPSVDGSGNGYQNGESERPEKMDDLSLNSGIIKWGGVRARSSNKRPRLGDHIPWVTGTEASANHNPIHHFESEGNKESKNGVINVSPHSGTLGDATVVEESQCMFAKNEGLDGQAIDKSFNLNECMGSRGAIELELAIADDTTTSYNQYTNGIETHPGLCNPEPSTRLRINSEGIKIKSFGDRSYDEFDGLLGSSSCMDHSLTSAGSERNGISGINSKVEDKCLTPDQRNENFESHGQDTVQLGLQINSKSYAMVYRRSRSQKARPASETNGSSREPSASGASNGDQTTEPEFLDFPIEGSRRTRSMGLKSNSISLNRAEQNLSEERQASSRMAIGLRPARNKRGSHSVGGRSLINKRSHQPDRKRSWLMLSIHDGLRYIPQLGDEVVYLRQGHQEYMEECKVGGEEPWTSMEGEVRAVEFCKVEELEYATFAGSGESCCKLVIKFIDPASGVCGESFNLTLPEVTGFPDFLIERTRFDAAIQNNWTRRDKCLVWWKNEDEEDGSWWEGRIVGVEPKSLEFLDSPWERYIIQYKSDSGTTHRHSPWELYANDTKCEQPHIDNERKEKLLAALTKLEQSGNRTKDLYGFQILQQTSEKSYFCNRFPVPLSLDVIHSRLENNYYRSLEAFQHDVEVMLSNAASYFERNAEVSPKMRRLSDWFTRTLSSL